MFAICRLAEEECRAERERRQLETQAQLMELENRMADSGDQGEDGGEDGEGQRKGLDDAALDPATDGGSEGDPTEGAAAPTPPPPREDSLCLASLLAFRVYDGYQRQESLTRDTLQRFLSDVHGEESYKQPAVRSVLDRIFAEGGNDAAGGEGGSRQERGRAEGPGRDQPGHLPPGVALLRRIPACPGVHPGGGRRVRPCGLGAAGECRRRFCASYNTRRCGWSCFLFILLLAVCIPTNRHYYLVI